MDVSQDTDIQTGSQAQWAISIFALWCGNKGDLQVWALCQEISLRICDLVGNCIVTATASRWEG